MKVTNISYKKIFPIAQFVNETIGIEMQADEGDNVDDVYEAAKKKVHEWHSGAKSPPTLVDPPSPEEATIHISPDASIALKISKATCLEDLTVIKSHITEATKLMYTKKVRQLLMIGK
jgi:hypothetical protein